MSANQHRSSLLQSIIVSFLWLLSVSLILAQPASLKRVAILDVAAELVEVEGTRVYTTAGSTLSVIDLSDPVRPSVLGTLTAPGRIWGLHVAGQYVYLAGGLNGLHIVDVSNPDNPTLLSTHQTPGQVLDVTTSGDIAMVPNLMTGLELVDISDRTEPLLLFTQDTPGYQWGIGGKGSKVYVVDQPSGLHLFDISDPTAPAALGIHFTEQRAQTVALDTNNHAYVVYARSGLVEILDVTDAANPYVIGSYQSGEQFQRVALQGFTMVLPLGKTGIEIVDVSNPESPSHVTTYNTSGNAQDVAVSDGFILVANSDGLVVLEHH